MAEFIKIRPGFGPGRSYGTAGKRRKPFVSDTTLRAYISSADPQHAKQFVEAMEAKGYYAFFEFVEEIRKMLKTYGDGDKESVGRLLTRLRADFPAPERFSPSWQGLWDELDGIWRAKNELLSEVPPEERGGEWQVQLDNPYTPDQPACYPGLTFSEAVYLFAYFRQELKPNEYLRLQKVSHVKVVTPGK